MLPMRFSNERRRNIACDRIAEHAASMLVFIQTELDRLLNVARPDEAYLASKHPKQQHGEDARVLTVPMRNLTKVKRVLSDKAKRLRAYRHQQR